MFKRAIFQTILKRLKEPRRYIQVLSGPRQVGKTTLSLQVAEALDLPHHYAVADEPTVHDRLWIQQQWEIGRRRAKETKAKGALLVLDELQKIRDWSEVVKRLWDEDTRNKLPLKVIFLGSAPLLIQHGLTESLAGRFEIVPVTHWSLNEMQEAFGFTEKQYIYFGGYPGAANLITDETRWRRYIIDSLIETTVSRDILLMTPVNKPALLKRLFHLGCDYSGQILSYQKMIGQLQDVGNTTTLAHYLELLSGAGMLTGLSKYSGQRVRQRGSSPKFQVLNTALMSSQSSFSFEEAQQNPNFWGRLLESAIGACLINNAIGTDIEIFYWREGHQEVDFVLKSGKKLTAIEIKSGYRKETLSGMEIFYNNFKPQHTFLIGNHGISIEEFLKTPIQQWIE